MHYIRSDIPHRRRDDLEHIIDSHMRFELIIMEMSPNFKEKWLYALGYKPHRNKESRFFFILNERSNIVSLGDYNCNLLEENFLAHMYDAYELHNLVTSDTCFKGAKCSRIDPCLASNPLRFKAALYLDCWLSHFHNIVCITTKLNMPRRSPNVIKYRSYNNFDQSKFTYDLYVLS